MNLWVTMSLTPRILPKIMNSHPTHATPSPKKRKIWNVTDSAKNRPRHTSTSKKTSPMSTDHISYQIPRKQKFSCKVGFFNFSRLRDIGHSLGHTPSMVLDGPIQGMPSEKIEKIEFLGKWFLVTFSDPSVLETVLRWGLGDLNLYRQKNPDFTALSREL